MFVSLKSDYKQAETQVACISCLRSMALMSGRLKHYLECEILFLRLSLKFKATEQHKARVNKATVR
jgi:hypothetical protein